LKMLSSESSPPATVTPKGIHGSEKFVLNLSEQVLTESVLKRGINFAVTNTVPNLDMVRVCAAESARSKLPPSWV
jgi:hypothetical protein